MPDNAVDSGNTPMNKTNELYRLLSCRTYKDVDMSWITQSSYAKESQEALLSGKKQEPHHTKKSELDALGQWSQPGSSRDTVVS